MKKSVKTNMVLDAVYLVNRKGGRSMNDRIKGIYDMMYSPILTPYDLLENAKLGNYKYVKYYSNDIGIVAEMQCVIADDDVKTFHYQFDDRDFLQEIYCDLDGGKDIIFRRETGLEDAKNGYYGSCGKCKTMFG